MKIIKPIIFGSLIIAALSVTQMDAFAWRHPGDRFRPEIQQAEGAPKFHTVLRHPEENNSVAAGARREVKPEVLTSHGIVNEDDVGAAHPESLSKTEACFDSPKGCT